MGFIYFKRKRSWIQIGHTLTTQPCSFFAYSRPSFVWFNKRQTNANIRLTNAQLFCASTFHTSHFFFSLALHFCSFPLSLRSFCSPLNYSTKVFLAYLCCFFQHFWFSLCVLYNASKIYYSQRSPFLFIIRILSLVQIVFSHINWITTWFYSCILVLVIRECEAEYFACYPSHMMGAVRFYVTYVCVCVSIFVLKHATLVFGRNSIIQYE